LNQALETLHGGSLEVTLKPSYEELMEDCSGLNRGALRGEGYIFNK